MNKKILAVIAAVAIIVAAIVGVWYYNLTAQKVEMEDIDIYLTEKTGGLEVNMITIPMEKGFSGTAALTINYNNVSEYEGPISIKDGVGTILVPYTRFVTENGEYVVEVTFNNKTVTKTHNIYGVVTKIDVYATARLDGTQPKIGVEVWPDVGKPLGGTAVVNITKVGGSTLVTAESLSLSEAGIYSGAFSYTNSGYYTIYVTLTNPVKSDSEYLEITKENLTFINLQPNVQSPPDNTTNLAPNGSWGGRGKDGWINFDATGLATDYDGDITVYAWDFGYNETLGRPANATNNETNDFAIGIKVSYQYKKEGIYTVTLSVLDNESYANNANCAVTVHKIPI